MAGSDDAIDRQRGADGVDALLGQAAGIGNDAALVGGTLRDLAAAGAAKAAAVRGLAGHADRAAAASRVIAGASEASREQLARARAAAGHVAEGVIGVAQALRQLGTATGDIAGIALQTRLVAFNASVEAKRSPEADQGLAVVADTVKDLAGKIECASKLIAATLAQLEVRVAELGVEVAGDASGPDRGRVQQALAEAERSVERIGQAAQRNLLACETLGAGVRASADGVEAITAGLGGAQRATLRLLGVSEALAELALERGVKTDDSRYVAAVLDAAAHASAVFGEALRRGEISAEELFDEHYAPIAGPDSSQCSARFLVLTDRVLPGIQEPLLQLSPEVVFCAAVDRNGYLPMYSQRRADTRTGEATPEAITRHSRRILQDRIGLAAGRSRRRFLLQTYRCSTGGGRRVLMKDLSAPIVVDGRHWGALRIGYAPAAPAGLSETDPAAAAADPLAKATTTAR